MTTERGGIVVEQGAISVDAARFRRAGYWRDDSLVSILDGWASKQPDKVFCVDASGRRLTYGEADARAGALAVSLRGLGVGVGDRVVVQLPNWTEFAIVYLGVIGAGAVLVPCMPVHRADEVRYLIESSGAGVLVVPGNFRGFDHAAMAEQISESVPGLATVVVRGSGSGIDFEDASTPGDLEPEMAEAGSDAAHVILYTSGTESRPKGCTHSWNTFSFTPRAMGDLIELSEDSVCFMPSPLAHTTGLAMGLVAPLLFGASTVIQDVFDPKQALDLVSQHGCTYTVGATPFLKMMTDAVDPAAHDLSRFAIFACGGAPVPPEPVQAAKDRLGCRVVTVYGQSETLIATITRLDDSIERVSSSDGRAVDGVEVAILDPGGREVASGDEGEICHRGPGLMLGYWGQPELTAQTIDANGWCHSGDLGRMDDSGYVRVTGRIKDIIVRGGMNISAREIEERLLRHPKVREVAVIGAPDERLGEIVCACVVPRDEAPTLEEITAFLSENQIAIQKFPQRLEIMDALPMNATGKVQKFKLRSSLA